MAIGILKKSLFIFFLFLSAYTNYSYGQVTDSVSTVIDSVSTIDNSIMFAEFPHPRHNGPVNHLSLYGGYTMSGKNKFSTHGFEIGVAKDVFIPYFASSVGCYISNEFQFNSKGFFIGPKVGCYLQCVIFCIGSEVIVYNDFKKSSTHIVPYLGLGVPGIRLMAGPHLPLYNKDFKEKRYISFNFSINIFNISKKKFFWKGPWDY